MSYPPSEVPPPQGWATGPPPGVYPADPAAYPAGPYQLPDGSVVQPGQYPYPPQAGYAPPAYPPGPYPQAGYAPQQPYPPAAYPPGEYAPAPGGYMPQPGYGQPMMPPQFAQAQQPMGPRKTTIKVRKGTSHSFHLIMSILTAGVWAILVWIPLTLWHKFGPRRKVTHKHTY